MLRPRRWLALLVALGVESAWLLPCAHEARWAPGDHAAHAAASHAVRTGAASHHAMDTPHAADRAAETVRRGPEEQSREHHQGPCSTALACGATVVDLPGAAPRDPAPSRPPGVSIPHRVGVPLGLSLPPDIPPPRA